MDTLTVDLGERAYPIYIGEGILTDDSIYRRHIVGSQVMIVTNEVVAPLYLEQTVSALSGFTTEVVILPDGEKYKNLEVWQRIFDALLGARFNRQCTILALGGGVIGDMAGFAAACYQRGVQFLQVPTTLLAQVDSSVGGKTGVNHPLGKNMIGAFYQPRCVVADTTTLNTLADRQLSAGIAEVIKYGLINDAPFFGWLEQNVHLLMRRDPGALAHAVRRSCEDKAEIVAADELEAGRRALLNLGHTFGHAIETGAGYGAWLHGEAVAVGICMAADLSRRLGWIDEGVLGRIFQLLRAAGLPTSAPPGIGPDRFLELMAVDKKIVDGKIRLVLLRGIGEAVLTEEFGLDLLKSTLIDFLKNNE